MQTLAFGEGEVAALASVYSAVLLLGNLSFSSGGEPNDRCDVTAAADVVTAAELMQVPPGRRRVAATPLQGPSFPCTV